MAKQTKDAKALKSLEDKMALVKDRVTQVVHGLQTGFFFYGEGGIGKSFTVLNHLQKLEAPYRLFNSRMTAKGLFYALAQAPDAIHVLEDMERLVRDQDAQGILRSALWSQPGHPREVTWTTATGGQERFTFRGGIILLSNCPLANLPQLRALATRIAVYKLEVTDAEMEALMRQQAAAGYKKDGKVVMEPKECQEVVEYVIEQCRKAQVNPSMRTLVNAYSDRYSHDHDLVHCHWKDMVTQLVKSTADQLRHEVNLLSPEEKKAQRRKLLREILKQTDNVQEQERLYEERTEKSRADFFRRKAEIQSGEFDTEVSGS
jgi:hypothetical protein